MLRKKHLTFILLCALALSLYIFYVVGNDPISYTEIPDCKAEGLTDCDSVVGVVRKYDFQGELDPPVTFKLEYSIWDVPCYDKTDVRLAYYNTEFERWYYFLSIIDKKDNVTNTVEANFTNIGEGYVAIINSDECVRNTCIGKEGPYMTNPYTGHVRAGNEIDFFICNFVPECEAKDNGVCDPNCLQGSDPDCVDIDCTSEKGDCCLVSEDNVCDYDCAVNVDPDCVCVNTADCCCNSRPDDICDPDCFIYDSWDPDCHGGKPFEKEGEFGCGNIVYLSNWNMPSTHTWYNPEPARMELLKIIMQDTTTECGEMDTVTVSVLYADVYPPCGEIIQIKPNVTMNHTYPEIKQAGFTSLGTFLPPRSRDWSTIRCGHGPSKVQLDVPVDPNKRVHAVKVDFQGAGWHNDLFVKCIKYDRAEDKDQDLILAEEDCGDNNTRVGPLMQEICNKLDDNCDPSLDIDEADTCKQQVSLCKTNAIEGKLCADSAWCGTAVTGDNASCTYPTSTDEAGLKLFYNYICDMNTEDGDYGCNNYVNGDFAICSEAYNCSDPCGPGDCDTARNMWCNDQNLWVSDYSYCPRCGQFDYDCGGECIDNTCDIAADRWCNNGRWDDREYCEHCSLLDSSCGSDCTEGKCDIVSDQHCSSGQWVALNFCATCDWLDSNCNATCAEATCDVEANEFCDDSNWTFGGDSEWVASEQYCSGCADFDKDCGTVICQDLACDITYRKYCDEGEWTFDPDNYCWDSRCGEVDPLCDPIKCPENWLCTEWSECENAFDIAVRECKDLHKCRTTDEKPPEMLKCYQAIGCQDNDEDGYGRFCVEEENETLKEDCDDSNAYVNPAAVDVCDGIDNNCDETIDEGCPCIEGEVQACGSNTGACRAGTQRCTGGRWGLCRGINYIAPANEACNDGLDNNCNGYTDENCLCEEGATQECGSDTGECNKGTQKCFNGTWSSVCSGAIEPSLEVCGDSFDNDCDAKIDADDDSCSALSGSCYDGQQNQNEEGVDCGGRCPACPSCKDRKKNQGEDDVDCGGPCPPCDASTASLCSDGEITASCFCGENTYSSGYCCSGQYRTSECPEVDTDGDGLSDDIEVQKGTDPLNEDTDEDGDNDKLDMSPLCNADGKCDSNRKHPETAANCPADCGVKGNMAFVIVLILLVLALGAGAYYYMYMGKGKEDKHRKMPSFSGRAKPHKKVIKTDVEKKLDEMFKKK